MASHPPARKQTIPLPPSKLSTLSARASAAPASFGATMRAVEAHVAQLAPRKDGDHLRMTAVCTPNRFDRFASDDAHVAGRYAPIVTFHGAAGGAQTLAAIGKDGFRLPGDLLPSGEILYASHGRLLGDGVYTTTDMAHAAFYAPCGADDGTSLLVCLVAPGRLQHLVRERHAGVCVHVSGKFKTVDARGKTLANGPALVPEGEDDGHGGFETLATSNSCIFVSAQPALVLPLFVVHMKGNRQHGIEKPLHDPLALFVPRPRPTKEQKAIAKEAKEREQERPPVAMLRLDRDLHVVLPPADLLVGPEKDAAQSLAMQHLFVLPQPLLVDSPPHASGDGVLPPPPLIPGLAQLMGSMHTSANVSTTLVVCTTAAAKTGGKASTVRPTADASVVPVPPQGGEAVIRNAVVRSRLEARGIALTVGLRKAMHEAMKVEPKSTMTHLYLFVAPPMLTSQTEIEELKAMALEYSRSAAAFMIHVHLILLPAPADSPPLPPSYLQALSDVHYLISCVPPLRPVAVYGFVPGSCGSIGETYVDGYGELFEHLKSVGGPESPLSLEALRSPVAFLTPYPLGYTGEGFITDLAGEPAWDVVLSRPSMIFRGCPPPYLHVVGPAQPDRSARRVVVDDLGVAAARDKGKGKQPRTAVAMAERLDTFVRWTTVMLALLASYSHRMHASTAPPSGTAFTSVLLSAALDIGNAELAAARSAAKERATHADWMAAVELRKEATKFVAELQRISTLLAVVGQDIFGEDPWFAFLASYRHGLKALVRGGSSGTLLDVNHPDFACNIERLLPGVADPDRPLRLPPLEYLSLATGEAWRGVSIRLQPTPPAMVEPWLLKVGGVTPPGMRTVVYGDVPLCETDGVTIVDEGDETGVVLGDVYDRESVAGSGEGFLLLADRAELSLLDKVYFAWSFTRTPLLFLPTQPLALLVSTWLCACAALTTAKTMEEAALGRLAQLTIQLSDRVAGAAARSGQVLSVAGSLAASHAASAVVSEELTDRNGVLSVAVAMAALMTPAGAPVVADLARKAAGKADKTGDWAGGLAFALLAESISREARAFLRSTKQRAEDVLDTVLTTEDEVHEEHEEATMVARAWRRTGRFFRDFHVTNCGPRAVVGALAVIAIVHGAAFRAASAAETEAEATAMLVDAVRDGRTGMRHFLEDHGNSELPNVTQVALFCDAVAHHKGAPRDGSFIDLMRKDPTALVRRFRTGSLKRRAMRYAAEVAAADRLERRLVERRMRAEVFRAAHTDPVMLTHAQVATLNLERPSDDQIELDDGSGLPRHHCAYPSCPLFLAGSLATRRDRERGTRHGLFRHLQLDLDLNANRIPAFHVLATSTIAQHGGPERASAARVADVVLGALRHSEHAARQGEPRVRASIAALLDALRRPRDVANGDLDAQM